MKHFYIVISSDPRSEIKHQLEREAIQDGNFVLSTTTYNRCKLSQNKLRDIILQGSKVIFIQNEMRYDEVQLLGFANAKGKKVQVLAYGKEE